MKTHTQVVFPMMAIFAIAMMLGTPSAFADTSEVTIVTGSVPLSAPGCEETNQCYDPADAVVDVGGKVTMINTDTTGIHTYTSGTVDGFAASPDGKFDSGILNANDSFEWTPDTVGEYPYYCMLHVWMQGTIVVQEASAEKDTSGDGKMMDDSKMSMKMDLDEIMAQITTSDGMINEPMTIDLTMTDLEGNGIEHITYNIKATQGTDVILDEEGHMHQGTLTNSHVTAALPADASDSMPVVILVESVGFGHDDMYEAVSGEIATMQVVPEFGTIAMMILAVAIISIVAVTAKSRLSIMPRI